MNEILQALQLCKWAPSGGNNQPWDIAVEEFTGDALTIRLSLSKECREADLVMEACGIGALYSLGTISHVAQKIFVNLGWDLVLDQFIPHESAYQCQAILQFNKTKRTPKSLSDIEVLIKNRRSNRGLFMRSSVSESTKNSLSVILKKYLNLKLFTYEDTRNKVAQIIGKLEDLRCQNKRLSEEFLSEIHFTPTQTGLPSYTLGQPFWSLMITRLWKSFRPLRIQFFMGAQIMFRYLAVNRPIKNSAGLFAIQATKLDNVSIYQVGQCLVECWFTLIEQGYAVQIFGIPLLSLSALVHPHAQQIFSNKERRNIRQVTDGLKKYEIDIEKPCIMFRCGIATEQALLTPRRAIEITVNGELSRLT